MVRESVRRTRFGVALVAFLLSAAVTVLAFDEPGAVSKPVAEDGKAPAAAPRGKQHALRIGLSYGDTLTWKSDHELAIGLDDALRLGADWIRIDLSWNNIQPSNSYNYNWHRFDRLVAAAQERDLQILATIAYTPEWARKPGCPKPTCPPADPQAFAAFAKLAAQRYAPKGIHYWEIWNEQNIRPFWFPNPDPAAYAELLKVTARAIRGADRDAYLLFGGLAVVGDSRAKGFVSDLDFVESVSRRGGNKVVDAISYHPYTYPHLPSARTDFGTAFEKISTAKKNLVAVLQRHGTPRLPIWITETGAPTDGPGGATDGRSKESLKGVTHVTERRQAEIAADTMAASAANDYVESVFWFAQQDSGTKAQRSSRSRFYGLRRYDGTAKPSYEALQRAIEEYERSLDKKGD
ncbi:cellulase family glycosylhydrolase [Streptomyces polyrhachis]|uniref:Cellulase family glycosylhydrolase n=1 Tax=Streptomyces polyrhachis TaxID=1282885 RepID=A0ABW2GE92_9ACTN